MSTPNVPPEPPTDVRMMIDAAELIETDVAFAARVETFVPPPSDFFWPIACRDGGKCVYCDLDGTADVRLMRMFTVDHLIPQRAGGADRAENYVLSCRGCNGFKGGHYDPSVDVSGQHAPSVAVPSVIEDGFGRRYPASDEARSEVVVQARGKVSKRRESDRYYPALLRQLKGKPPLGKDPALPATPLGL
jgi:hypothetical protein